MPKRAFQESDDDEADDGAAVGRPVKYRLRGRDVEPVAVFEGRRGVGRNKRDFIYPSEIGPRSANARGTMGAEVTSDLAASIPRDSLASSVARGVRPLRAGGRTELKARNVSRNHILADSRIRIMLETVYARPGPLTAPQQAAVEELFHSLAGSEVGADLHDRFIDARDRRSRAGLDEVVNEACEGRENLRFGLADINTAVSNEFDPIVIDGRLDERSARIRDAVLDLSRTRLIEHGSAFDALAVTKDRATHEDVTSTALRSSTLARDTGSRTVIDPFARPFNESRLARRQSIDLGRPSEAAASARAPAREWHHGSLGGTDLEAPGVPMVE